jgi:hypothetical protein
MMNGTPTNEMAGVSEKVLKNITELYEHGLSPGAHGSIGVCAMAQDLGLHKQIRKPRKKIRSAETACWQSRSYHGSAGTMAMSNCSPICNIAIGIFVLQCDDCRQPFSR